LEELPILGVFPHGDVISLQMIEAHICWFNFVRMNFPEAEAIQLKKWNKFDVTDNDN
jgi:hypothetical protein